jgi:hypothetical protein
VEANNQLVQSFAPVSFNPKLASARC